MLKTSEQFIKGYRTYLKIERGMSLNTYSSYCSDIREFISCLSSESGTDIDPRSIQKEDISEYVNSLPERDVSKRSQARILSSMRSFFKWLMLEGEIKENPCDGIASPKPGRHLPSVLSVEEVDSIISSVDTSTEAGMRDRAILEVLYGCGLRVSEASELKISCIYLDEGFVRIVGKGDKERLVPLGEPAREAIINYLSVRREPADRASGDILFLNKSGKRLSRVSIFNMVKKQAAEAGIAKELSPHTFRHSFATHLIEGGADLRVVQEMLGHENILTTEIYTHIDSSKWQKDIMEHHPEA
ncbi:MAG: site-specific tyrosine recombinase XerD [Bacteroidales bacterium]|nr:site-specific tyrosine recombinase XerD [Bacteroidales bacterium]